MKYLSLLLPLLFLSSFVFSQSGEIVINEILASNSSINHDSDFQLYSDWFELYNPQDEAFDLSYFYLTDNLDEPQKWQIPEGIIIYPGEFLIFWADGKDTLINEYHTNFKLSKSGEEIALFDQNLNLIDSISFYEQQTNTSYGRQPDGGVDWYFFSVPSPGEGNFNPILNKCKTPEFSLSGGFFQNEQILEITKNDPQAVIRYTLNGNEPDEQSQIYTSVLTIKPRKGDSNIFSEIKTNSDPFIWLPDWEAPNGEVFKGSIVRARVFKEGYEESEIETASFFIDNNIDQRYSILPVISIVSDFKHLFDQSSGIYVPGIYHSNGNSGSGNYFQDWEKPAHIEYFDVDRNIGFSQDVGIRIQGGTSPASPQKGLHVIARSEYGKNRFNYPLFENDPTKARDRTEFKRFIIRAWGSLITGSLFNDAYAHRLMANKGLDLQAYQPVVVFINGEYWGLHALREANKNSWYYQYHYDIDREDPGIDLLIHSTNNGQPYAYIDEGDKDHWNYLMQYINTHDMTLQGNYDHFKTQIDLDNFITYIGHCIYISKWDWPNNNDASWRPRTPEGIWKWIQFDMETGFGVASSLGPEYALLGPQFNMIEASIEGREIPYFGKYGPHPILSKLIQNQSFKESFISWFEEAMENEFLPENMNNLLDEMAEEIRPYMKEYKDRWPFIGDVDGEWANSLDQIRDFNNRRPEFMKMHLEQLLNPVIEYKLYQNYPNPFKNTTTIEFELPEAGHVEITVFDMLGRKIICLLDEPREAGRASVSWHPNVNKTGVFFYTIKVGSFTSSRKMFQL